MAKSKDTYSKREKEKKRQKDKEDKKQKKEERKLQKKDGNQLEGMMAYLDENGNLTDTPPDPRLKREINAEDIDIGVPVQDHKKSLQRTGIVRFFNTEKGYGFINDNQTGDKIFFHMNDLLEPVAENQHVEFMTAQGDRGLKAIQISVIRG